MAKPSAKKIINDRGGYKAVAAALTPPPGREKFPETTVHSWVRHNRLPAWRVDAVLALPILKQQAAA